MRYHAFISYSHGADARLAPALQRALHRFAKPWWKARAVDVFRDETSLAVAHNLPATLTAALAASEHFILMASPPAAQSKWVASECRLWALHKNPERMLIVLTGGEIAWDEASGDFNWTTTNSLPPVLKGVFKHEPLYIDLRWAKIGEHFSVRDPRFLDATARISAALRGMSLDKIAGEEVRQHRRTRRVAYAAVSAIAVLAAGATMGAWIATERGREAERAGAEAVRQRSEAERQRDRATAERNAALLTQSRFLADLSNQLAESGDSVTATLLALAGLPDKQGGVARPLAPEAEAALYKSLSNPREIAILSVPDTRVENASWSADGALILTVQTDESVRVWDGKTGRLLSVTGPFAAIEAAFFDPSGDRIAVRTKGGAFLIDALTGKQVEGPTWQKELLKQASAIRGLMPDWSRAIIVSPPAVAAIDRETGSLVDARPLEEPGRDIEFAFTDASGKYVMSESGAVWDAMTGRKIAGPAPQTTDDGVSAAKHALSTDGSRRVTGYYDGTARLNDLKSGDAVATLRHPEDERIKGAERDSATVYHATFSPNQRWLATASADKTVRLWDAATADLVSVLRGHADKVRDVAFSPDGGVLLTRSDDGTARLWRAVSVSEVLPPKHLGEHFMDVFIRQNSIWLVTLMADGSVVIWDYVKGSAVATLRGHTPKRIFGPTTRVAIDPDGRRIITAAGDLTARVWDIASGRELSRIEADPKASMVYDVGFSRDGRLAYATASDLHVWEIESGKVLHKIKVHDRDTEPNARHVRCASFNPDASLIVAGASTIKIYEVKTGQVVRRFERPLAECTRFSPDGRRIAHLDAMSETVHVLDAATGTKLFELRGHDHFVLSVEFSPDGKLLLTSSMDSTVRIWDASSGRNIRILTDVGGIFHAHFSPDGGRIITDAGGPALAAPWRGRVWLSIADLDSLIAHAKAAVPRCLTGAQLKQYFLESAPMEWCAALEKHPYDIEARSRDLCDARRYDEALALLAKTLARDPARKFQIDPNLAYCHNERAWAAYRANRFAEALPDADRAVAAAPNSGSALDTRAQIYLKLGRSDEALADLDRAIALGYEKPSTFYAFGLILEQRGLPARAAEAYRKAVALNAEDDFNRQAQGEAQRRLDALAKAR